MQNEIEATNILNDLIVRQIIAHEISEVWHTPE